MIQTKILNFKPINYLNQFLQSIILLIQLSNQFPSVFIYKSKFYIFIIFIGILCSFFLRNMTIDLNSLSLISLFLFNICIFLTILYLVNLLVNSIQRVYNSIRLGPTFDQLLENNSKLPEKNRKNISGIV